MTKDRKAALNSPPKSRRQMDNRELAEYIHPKPACNFTMLSTLKYHFAGIIFGKRDSSFSLGNPEHLSAKAAQIDRFRGALTTSADLLYHAGHKFQPTRFWTWPHDLQLCHPGCQPALLSSGEGRLHLAGSALFEAKAIRRV